jgi:hypothetical protein
VAGLWKAPPQGSAVVGGCALPHGGTAPCLGVEPSKTSFGGSSVPSTQGFEWRGYLGLPLAFGLAALAIVFANTPIMITP